MNVALSDMLFGAFSRLKTSVEDEAHDANKRLERAEPKQGYQQERESRAPRADAKTLPSTTFRNNKTFPVEPKLAPDEESRVRRSLREEELEVEVCRLRQCVRLAPDEAGIIEDRLHGSRQR